MATIYYICSIPPKAGGELVNLQHVASLNQFGIRAVALVNSDQVDGWSSSPVLPLEQLAPHRQFQPDDIVVIPEFYREALHHFATQPCQRIIHTQGPFLTFQGFDSIQEMNANGLYAGMACSTFGKNFMQRMGSNLDWQVVTPFVHPLFHERDIAKKLQVAYMPNKRVKEAPVVYSLFRHMHPEFDHVPWVPIAGMSRAACADIMAESAVFANFSRLEGLGLPPLEAMASGCLVCGFDGHGGSDYARPDNGLWVPEGDHESFAHAVATLLKQAQDNDEKAMQQRTAGKHTVAHYSRERFERELMTAWRTILGKRWSHYAS